jgi:hypothetical protein
VSKAAIISFRKVELLAGAMDLKTDQVGDALVFCCIWPTACTRNLTCIARRCSVHACSPAGQCKDTSAIGCCPHN